MQHDKTFALLPFLQPSFSRLTSIKKIVYGVTFLSPPKFTPEKHRWLDISPYSNLCVLIQSVDLTYKKISSGCKEKLNSLRSGIMKNKYYLVCILGLGGSGGFKTLKRVRLVSNPDERGRQNSETWGNRKCSRRGCPFQAVYIAREL